MKYLILSGGIPPKKDELAGHIKKADCVIGVDGAADVLYLYNIKPHILIGDFDTADPAHVKYFEESNVRVIKLPQEKNETDTEAAVNYAIDNNAGDILILGATGMRIDHTLANISMLVRAESSGVKCRIIDEYNEIMVSNKDFRLTGEIGQTISILPLTGELCVSATNLKYPLNDLNLRFGSARGVSNIMEKTYADLKITGGYALIIKNIQPA